MASVNKVVVDEAQLRALYVSDRMSLPLVAQRMSLSMSTLRTRLLAMGVLRARADAIRVAKDQGRLGVWARGKKRVFTQEWKNNIAFAARCRGEESAVGFSVKPSGYVVHTRGPNKGRAVHITIVEAEIGRRITAHEVVHHVDHDRSNNALSNLQLMTRSEHARLHALENITQRKRDANGKFK